MEILSEYSAVISAAAALLSAIVASAALIINMKTQKHAENRQKKYATIEAFNSLQEDVLDYLLEVNKQNAKIITEALDDGNNSEEVQSAYNAYKKYLARCEHFAVGVNSGIYDFETTNKLGGTHLINVFNKVSPAIEYSRRNSQGVKTFSEFETLVNKLRKTSD